MSTTYSTSKGSMQTFPNEIFIFYATRKFWSSLYILLDRANKESMPNVFNPAFETSRVYSL